MRAKLLLTMLAALSLCGVASAQSYAIRVTFNTNLRAAASLQANIIEIAPAGAILNVVGTFNRWLRIDRNGSEVFMASWVRHERVEDQAAADTQPQTVTNIDNCCFVDRQCMTDQEWVDGYYAFQNGQCAAPVQTQTQTSSQPVSVDDGQADNCCFLGWLCRTELEWVNGFHAYRDNQCGAATPAETVDSCCQLGWNCTIEADHFVGRRTIERGLECGAPIQVPFDGTIIEGTETFIAQVTAALELLRSRAPEWYAYVVKGPIKIRGGLDAGGTYAVLDTINLAAAHAAEATIVFAGTILHETCHAHRIRAGLFRFATEEQSWIEEQICEVLRVGALEQIDPSRPPNPYLEAALNDFFSSGGQFDFNAAAGVERERAFQLLAQNS